MSEHEDQRWYKALSDEGDGYGSGVVCPLRVFITGEND